MEEGRLGYLASRVELTLPGVAPVEVPRLLLPARPGSPEAPLVRLFIGTEPAQGRAERVLLYSIAKYRNPARRYEVTLLRDVPGHQGKWLWATSFSNFRFLVPLLAGATGKAIYQDVDQVYLADPAELFDHDMEGAGYRAVRPRETSVMLLDCARMAEVWSPRDVARLPRRWLTDRAANPPGFFAPVDAAWNCCDDDAVDPADAKLYHFTTLHMQPWRPFPERFVYHEHPAGEVWWRLRREADAAGFDAFAEGEAPGEPRLAGAPGELGVGELRALLQRAGAQTLHCVGPAAGLEALEVEVTAGGDDPSLDAGDTQADAALWVVGREGVPADAVPRRLHALFRRPRSLVVVRAGCRPGSAGVWWRPPRGSVGTERWWIDQLRAVATLYPKHRWELDLEELGGARRRLRPGGGAVQGAGAPRVVVLGDGDPENERRALEVAEAVAWPFERRAVTERSWRGALRRLHGPALMIMYG